LGGDVTLAHVTADQILLAFLLTRFCFAQSCTSVMLVFAKGALTLYGDQEIQ